MATPAGEWSVDEVAAWLKGMKVSATKAKKIGLTGHDLELMTAEELGATLGCTPAKAAALKADLHGKLQVPELDDGDDAHKLADAGADADADVDTSGAVPALGKGATALPDAKPKGNSDSAIDDRMLDRYCKALATIKRLGGTGIDTQLPAEEQKLKGMDEALAIRQREFTELFEAAAGADDRAKAAQKKKKKPAKKASGAEDTPPRGKKAAAAAEDDEPDETNGKLSAAEKVLDKARSAAEAQRLKVDRLRRDAKELSDARAYEADVVATIFRGPAKGDARENELEAAVEALAAGTKDVKQLDASYREVDAMLASGASKLDGAHDRWASAKHIGRWDWVTKKNTDASGNIVMDATKVSSCKAGLELAASGAADLERAKLALPDLPKLDAAQLAALKAPGGFKDAYSSADKAATEKDHHRALNANIKEAARLSREAKAAQKWLQKWQKERTGADATAAEAAIAAKKEELDAHRRELLQAELAKRGLAPEA